MKRKNISGIIAAAGLVVLAACGGGDDATESTQAPDVATESTEAPAEESAEPTPADLALARVDALLQDVTSLDLGPEPASVPEGKTVFYIACSVPVCAEIQTGVEEAVAALAAKGWTIKTTSHQDSPDTVAAAFDAAIAAKPDVIMTSGNPRDWFKSQLETLKGMGVPVISWSIPEPFEPGDGINVNILSGDDYFYYGVAMADYAFANSPNKNIVFVGLPVFPVLATVQEGFKTEIETICSECNVKFQEVGLGDLGTNLPGIMVSALQADPTIDFVAYAFGGMMFGVPEALDAAGLVNQAKAISQAGGPLNFGFITNGKHQTGELALASGLLGWRAVDIAITIFNDGSIPKSSGVQGVYGKTDIGLNGLPLQILTKDTIKDPAALWAGVAGYQDLFKKRWKL
jgi:ribose transport system substrate-binding protein